MGRQVGCLGKASQEVVNALTTMAGTRELEGRRGVHPLRSSDLVQHGLGTARECVHLLGDVRYPRHRELAHGDLRELVCHGRDHRRGDLGQALPCGQQLLQAVHRDLLHGTQELRAVVVLKVRLDGVLLRWLSKHDLIFVVPGPVSLVLVHHVRVRGVLLGTHVHVDTLTISAMCAYQVAIRHPHLGTPRSTTCIHTFSYGPFAILYGNFKSLVREVPMKFVFCTHDAPCARIHAAIRSSSSTVASFFKRFALLEMIQTLPLT